MTSIPPRILRYSSSQVGGPAFGLMLMERGGVPAEVFNLTAHDSALGSTFAEFNPRGFDVARTLWADPDTLTDRCETVSPEHILPPVDISMDDITEKRRFILSMGLNYHSHRAETNRGTDLIMVNATATTGPYDALHLVPECQLADIEAEVGCVLLEDIDLAAVPPMRDLESKLAYFTVNDLNDRAPMILDEKEGYTAGKSDPGFVPIGPWMAHGADLPIFSRKLGLEVTCLVTPRGGEPQRRQCDHTTGVIRNPQQILNLLHDQLALEPMKAHPDRTGKRHPFASYRRGKQILPAGSLILTGTPGGTALRAPKGLKKIGLLIRGGFSISGARSVYVRDLIRDAADAGYLLPGDKVETAVDQLGTQQWMVE